MMPDTPIISIIVPNYNHGPFLAQRLESIANQTYKLHEIILLDDASTDGSVELLKDFAQHHEAKLILNQKNSGSPFLQWNRGASEARGDLLWFAESDDYAAPTLLEKLVGYFRNHENLGIAYCRSRRVNEQGEPLDQVPSRLNEDGVDCFTTSRVVSGREEIQRELYYHSTIPNASAVVVKRDAFLEAQGAPAHMKLCGDWLVWLKVLCKRDLAYHAEPLNYFRAPHPNSQRHCLQTDVLRVKEWLEVTRYLRAQGLITSQHEPRLRAYLSQMSVEAVWTNLWKGEFRQALSCISESMRVDPLCLVRGGAWAVGRAFQR